MPKRLLVLTPKMCRDRRKSISMTGGRVAVKIKVRNETYCRWEKGRQKPSRKNLLALAKLLQFYNPASGEEVVIEWRQDADLADGQLTEQETDPADKDGPAGAARAGTPVPAETGGQLGIPPAAIAKPVVYLLNDEALNRTVNAIVLEKLDSFLAERETKEPQKPESTDSKITE